MIESFVAWVLSTPINKFVLDWNWTWVILECLHFVGLSLLLGSLLVIDLRLAGFFRRIPLAATHQLLPWVFVGFGINLVSGVLFFFGDPERYSINIGFQIKFFLIFLAGLNAVWFYLKIDKPMRDWDQHGDTPALAKLIGGGSLTIWFAVLIFGRLIPYVGTG